jgi:pyruvate/2-oxoglutarate dehydrogenase complex dihydrolipoamide acyltransferase (E2) component
MTVGTVKQTQSLAQAAPPGARTRASVTGEPTDSVALEGQALAGEETPRRSGWQRAGLLGVTVLAATAALAGCATLAAPVVHAAPGQSTSTGTQTPPAPGEKKGDGFNYLLRGKRGFGWLDRANDRLFGGEGESRQGPAQTSPAQAPAARPAETQAPAQGENRVHLNILKDLSNRGLLFEPGGDDENPDDFGRVIDAATARRYLDQGKAVMVKNPRIGNYEKFYTLAPPDARTLERHLVAEGDVVRSWDELARLNHAERLTGQNTSRSYTAEQRQILGLLQDFEGGVPAPDSQFYQGYFPGFYMFDYWGNYIYMSPGYYQGYRVTPNPATPALYSAKDEGGFLGIGSKPNRLSSYEALKRLEEGKGIRVVTSRGVSHTIQTVQELRELHELEAR